MMPHTVRDDRHQEYVMKVVEKNYPALEKLLAKKDSGAAKIKLHELLETVLQHGIGFALDSEANAWQRMTELEDVIIAIVKHAPESDLLNARKMAQGIEEGVAA